MNSKLEIDIQFDEEKVPLDIKWKNPDGSESGDCKAMLVSFFERNSRDTVRIDLWTKDMQVMEMDKFFFQSLRGMADTYLRATKNQKLANDFQKFVDYFGLETGVVSEKKVEK